MKQISPFNEFHFTPSACMKANFDIPLTTLLKENIVCMKKIKHLFILTVLMVAVYNLKAQMLLSQDFNASTSLNTYIGTGANQFDSIKVSSPSSSNTIYLSGNRLNLQRYGGSAHLSKTTNLSETPPDFLKVRFKLNVPFNSVPTVVPQTQATIYFGSSINSSVTTANEVRYASLGIGFATSGRFYLRSANFLNSDTLQYQQEVTWFLNNSGSSKDYIDPNNTLQTLADDTYDLWITDTIPNTNTIISTRVFTGIPATTPSTTMNQFKILFNGAIGGALAFDDIEISTGVTALPVNLLSFTGKAVNNNAVQLDWVTAKETNNKYFQILKSTNGVNFSQIATVKGNNNSQSTSNYSFTDAKPSVGTNYYQLKQVDNDGKSTTFNTVAVEIKTNGAAKLRILSNSKSEIKASVVMPKSAYGSIRLTDIDGRTIYQSSRNFKEGENVISIPVDHILSKICVLQFNNSDQNVSLKLFKQ